MTVTIRTYWNNLVHVGSVLWFIEVKPTETTITPKQMVIQYHNGTNELGKAAWKSYFSLLKNTTKGEQSSEGISNK